MKRPITIVIEGVMHQIRDYGLKEPTLLLYQNVFHTIHQTFKYSDDDEIIKKLSRLK